MSCRPVSPKVHCDPKVGRETSRGSGQTSVPIERTGICSKRRPLSAFLKDSRRRLSGFSVTTGEALPLQNRAAQQFAHVSFVRRRFLRLSDSAASTNDSTAISAHRPGMLWSPVSGSCVTRRVAAAETIWSKFPSVTMQRTCRPSMSWVAVRDRTASCVPATSVHAPVSPVRSASGRHRGMRRRKPPLETVPFLP